MFVADTWEGCIQQVVRFGGQEERLRFFPLLPLRITRLGRVVGDTGDYQAHVVDAEITHEAPQLPLGSGGDPQADEARFGCFALHPENVDIGVTWRGHVEIGLDFRPRDGSDRISFLAGFLLINPEVLAFFLPPPPPLSCHFAV